MTWRAFPRHSLASFSRSRVPVRTAFVFIACLAAGPVWAGAFNIPKGQGLAIVDFTFSGGSRYFNGLGKLAPANGFRRGDVSTYVEYGVTDWLMAVVRPDVTDVAVGGHPGGRYIGLGPSEVGAQLRLFAFGPAVWAFKGAFRVPGSYDTGNRALIGNTAREADLRGLFGLAFSIGPWPAFLDAQVADRLRDGKAPDELHTDVTVGLRPLPELMLLLQLFDTTDLGKGTSLFPHERFTHLETAVVYDFTETWSAEIGVYTTVLGTRSLREHGVTTSVWYRF